MNNSKAGVIISTRFVDRNLEEQKNYTNNKKVQTFKSYINYLDRDEAVRNESFNSFSLYNDYMGNPEKSDGIFTKDKDNLTKEEKKQIKDLFQQAYDNNSIMWQSVISFDNNFLQENNLYDYKTKSVNQDRLQELTRNVMREMLRSENMQESAIWTASIHYNTDNIHIHIATTQPIPDRQEKILNDGTKSLRGKLKPQTFKNMKSKAVNSILDKDRQKLDELSREIMIKGKRQHLSLEDDKFREMFLKIYKSLPDDRRKWHYSMNAITSQRKDIDNFSREFLNTYYKEEFKEYKDLLLKEQLVYKRAYGENSNFDKYAQNKINDLYKRMGNALLTEMREYSKHDILFNNNIRIKKKNSYSPTLENKARVPIGRALESLGKSFKQQRMSKQAYKDLQRELNNNYEYEI